MEYKIRVRNGAKELEAVGSENFVREQLDEVIAILKSGDSEEEENLLSSEDEKSDDTTQTSGEDSSGLPETFGEYLTQFPNGLSQEDQVLIAGYYVQKSSAENSFATKEANDLLKEQGIKVTNASQSIANSKKAKKVFAIGKKFRVSSPKGIEHIKSLLSD